MARQVTIGIDVGGTKVLGLAVDDEGVVASRSCGCRRRDGAGPSGVDGTTVIEARHPATERDTPRSSRGGVGRGGGAGPRRQHRGAALRPQPAPGHRARHRGRLSERLGGLRTVVDNDATCATVAEWAFGAAVGVTDAVMVTLGTGHRGRHRRRRERGAGGVGVRRGDRPHGGRPHGTAVPVRQAGLLGALRLGQRSRTPGPGGGPCRASRRGGAPRRWRPRVGAGGARHHGGQGGRRRRPGRAGRARVVAGAGSVQPGPRPRPRRHGVRGRAGRDRDPGASTRCAPPSTSCSKAAPTDPR